MWDVAREIFGDQVKRRHLKRLVYETLTQSFSSVPDNKRIPHPEFGTLRGLRVMDLLGLDVFHYKYQNEEFNILHARNYYSRFSYCRIINSVCGQEVLDFLIELRKLGRLTSRIVTDEGSEFANTKIWNFTRQSKVTHYTVAGKAHWSLGLVEQRH